MTGSNSVVDLQGQRFHCILFACMSALLAIKV